MASLRPALLFAFGFFGLPDLAHAGGTRSHEAVDFEDFDRGETEGAAIESVGRITVGYTPIRAEISAMTAFGCVGRDGAVYVTTADSASIVRIEPARANRRARKEGARELRSTTFARLEGTLVSALAGLPGGDWVAATLPGGKLHRIDKRGKVSSFAELKVDQIWALRVHGGRLLAATGPRGELWSLDLQGKDPKVILDAEDQDLLSLEIVGQDIIVGTSPSAHLLQVGDDLEGILLHEFTGEEVRALALTPRGLVAAVNDFSERKLSGLDALTKTLNRTSLVGQAPGGEKSSEENPASAESALYYVDLGPRRELARAAEAPWETWLERSKQYFTSVLADDDAVLVASSAGGKIYRVQNARSYATVADVEERQTTGLCRADAGGPIFATAGHGAAAYQLEAMPAQQARYRSEVFDAGQPARYGALVVRAQGALRVRARTGPTDEPNDRWGKWDDIKLARGPDGLRGSLASIGQRRYLQLEFILSDARSQLRAFELFYAPENMAPLVRSVDISPPAFSGGDDEEPKPTLTIAWEAKARDEDDLHYEVRMRPEGSSEASWVPLHRNEVLTKPEFKFDVTSVPDGVYEVSVRASDEPSNGSARALADELVSAPFIIDRQRPVIGNPTVTGHRIAADVVDAGGFIHDVSYSIDGHDFRTASVEDGLLDSPRERILVDLPRDLEPGNHRVVLRARDASGNLGTAALVVKLVPQRAE